MWKKQLLDDIIFLSYKYSLSATYARFKGITHLSMLEAVHLRAWMVVFQFAALRFRMRISDV